MARSRRARRARWALVLSALAGVLGGSAALGYEWLQHKERADRNIGRFHLELAAYDWDPRRHAPVPVSLDELPDLDWELYDPSEEDDLALGARRIDAARTPETSSGATRSWLVEAPGGRVQLRVVGRGRGGSRCAASVIPLHRLPGFASADVPRLGVRVPTCQASGADMIQIPAGPFLSGGLGEPRPELGESLLEKDLSPEQLVDEPAFSIDRTEVTNAAFRMFSTDASATVIAMPVYPNTVHLKRAGGDAYPISDVSWAEARAYCRFLGKELPTDRQWQKAMRGGVMLGAIQNPNPRRNLPWGAWVEPVPANLSDTGKGPAPVGSYPGDVSPYGVLDLAGNVQEWMWTSAMTEGFVIARGCYWETCTSQNLATYMAIPNTREPRFQSFDLGFRCVSGPGEPTAPASPAAPGR